MNGEYRSTIGHGLSTPITIKRGGRDRMIVVFTTTCEISATEVVSSNSDHGGMYSKQHYFKQYLFHEISAYNYSNIYTYTYNVQWDSETSYTTYVNMSP